MTPQRWQQVKGVFNDALDQPAGAVGAFLAQACGDDLELRAEVNRLLVEHFKGEDFLDQPLVIAPDDSGSLPDSTDVVLRKASSRFEFRGRLGSGGFGDVFEVLDRQRHSLVALKYLRRFDPDQLFRLKREFRTLTDLRHPNLIQVYELFSNSDPPFFTMELLKGMDLGQYFRATAQMRQAGQLEAYRQVAAYLVQLCHGLLALHEAQLVHRDVKPSNVFVTESGRVVLLDFGLVKQMSAPTSITTTAVAGTPHYLAPEQLNDGEVTPASDWYALGVLLFEAMTGRMPFDGDVLQVLSRKRGELPPNPRALAPHVPEDLAALCHQLLAPDPSDRPTGAEILRRLESGAAAVPAGAPAEPASRTPAVFLGREEYLQALHGAFADAERDKTMCVHVRGPSGIGKTGLVRSFLDSVRRSHPECVVLRGRCYESESAPHKGLDELVDRLAVFLKGLGDARVQSLLPRYFPLLTRLFPVLQQFQSVTRNSIDVADPREQRHRAFGCLRQILARIAESHRLVLWIDDLQWCDSDTIQLLNDLVRSVDPFGCLLLLSYRDVGIDTNPELAELDAVDRSERGGASVRVLKMENLPFADARQLALALLSEPDEGAAALAIAAAIARESKGNPFFVTEMARYVSSMPEARDLGTGAFGIGHVIKRRIALLSEPMLRLLELVAVAGQPLRADLCAQASGVGEAYLDARTTLTREHLLRTHVSRIGEELDVYHDQIREAVTGSLSHEAATVYHRLIADVLEKSGSTDYERLSIHCESAGERDKAANYTLLAARRAAESLAFDRAARLLGRVLELAGDTAPKGIHEELGEALSNAGRGKQAAEAFLRASENADPIERLHLRRRACEQYLRSGQVDEGVTLIRGLLRDVGVRYPESRLALLGSLVWHRIRLRVRLRWLMMTSPRKASVPTPADHLKLDVMWTGTLGMSLVDVVRGAEFQARYTLLATRSCEPRRLALALAGELALGRMDGHRPQKDTEFLFDSAMRLATECGNPHALAFTTSMHGIASWIRGEWRACYERSLQAAVQFSAKCSGVGWEITTANTFVLSALVFLGKWREYSLTFPALVQQAQALGDRHGAISLPLIAYAYILHLLDDAPERAHALIADALSKWPYKNFQMQHCDALIGNVETLLYTGNGSEALAALENHWRGVKRSHLLEIQFYRNLLNSVYARATLTAAVRAHDRERKMLVKRSRRFATRLRKSGVTWAVATAHLVEAGLATVEADLATAEVNLRRAETLFERAEMSHYLAASRFRLAQIRPDLTRERALAQQWIHEEGARNAECLFNVFAPGEWSRVS